MQPRLLLIAVLLLAVQTVTAIAGEITGEVQLIAGPFILLRTGTGQQVVRTGPWTAYGNMQGPGSLKYGGEGVKVSFVQKQAGVPLASAVVKESVYTPAADQVVTMEQLTVELGSGIVALVDSRSKSERDEANIPGSVPLTTATELVKSIKSLGGTKRVVFYGSSAGDLRPYTAAREAKSAGLADVRIFVDGLRGWRKAGKAVYTSPVHLVALLAKGEPFRLLDLRGSAPENAPLMAGAEPITASGVTREAIFLPQRSYQLPIFLYGDEQESLAVAAKLAEWNFHQDGDFAILDPTWRDWPGKYGESGYRPGQLAASEIGMAEFRAHWLKDDPAKVFLNVKPKRDRNSPSELHIPLEELPERLDELPRERELIIYCSYGLRSAVAARILQDNGFRARFLNRTISIDSSGAIKNDN